MAAGTPLSGEVFNTREEVISADVMRLQNLASKEFQDALQRQGASFDGADPTHAHGLLAVNGSPISGADQAATLFGIAATFTGQLGAGSGYFYYPSGLDADYSGYQVVRWPQQVVTFANPSGSDRIDTVVATPATALGDDASRFILNDPVARTITAQLIHKTRTPQSTITVLTGTPSGSPLPPTVPAGSVALFDVYVPTGSTAANQFFYARRFWRRAPFPWAAMAGVISGMQLTWDQAADPTAASSKITLQNGFHRVVIDGEILELDGTLDSVGGGVIQDTGNNPLGSAAPAANDRPYYIYAVGGRNNPYPVLNGTTFSPFILVESLIPPVRATGKPTGTLATPRYGVVQAGATYVGLGFTAFNSTRRRGCIMSGPMTYCAGGGLFEGQSVPLTGGSDGFTLPSAPLVSDEAAVVLQLQNAAGATHGASVYGDKGDTTGPSPSGFPGPGVGMAVVSAGPTATGQTSGRFYWPAGAAAKFWARGVAADTLIPNVNGYRHGVNRFDGLGSL